MINTAGALLHRVPQGLLLVWPDAFRAFLVSQGVGAVSERTLKRLRLSVFDTGLHLCGGGGIVVQDTEVATRIAGQLPSEGQSAAFKEFVWRFVNVMARALVALGRTPDYEAINRHASDIEPLLVDYFEQWLDREPAAAVWRDELERHPIDKKSLDKGLQSRGLRAVSLVEFAQRRRLYDPIAHALASTLAYEKSHFDKLVASLLPLMEKLTTGRTATLLSPAMNAPGDWRPVFDWNAVINLRGIVYVGLDALSDYEVAAAVKRGGKAWAPVTPASMKGRWRGCCSRRSSSGSR